jgi:hypothetical protein
VPELDDVPVPELDDVPDDALVEEDVEVALPDDKLVETEVEVTLDEVLDDVPGAVALIELAAVDDPALVPEEEDIDVE